MKAFSPKTTAERKEEVMSEIVDRARKASAAIYLVVDEAPAKDISEVFISLAEYAEALEARVKELEGEAAYLKTAGCRAAQDGECSWIHCPQLRDGEPHQSGRHCPLDVAFPSER